jgi:hypothetical protein
LAAVFRMLALSRFGLMDYLRDQLGKSNLPQSTQETLNTANIVVSGIRCVPIDREEARSPPIWPWAARPAPGSWAAVAWAVASSWAVLVSGNQSQVGADS